MTAFIMVDGQIIQVPDDDPRVPQPQPAATLVPQTCSPRQGKLALYGAGLLDQVNAVVAAADVPTQIWFAEATVWERENPIILGFAAKMNPPLTDAQVDALFTQAAAL